MQLLGKCLCICPSIWFIIALFPMLDNEFWDLQNLHWKIVKSLFTFSNHELNAGSISQQSWKNVSFDVFFFSKERQLVINKYILRTSSSPQKESFSFLSHELMKFPYFSLTSMEFPDFPWPIFKFPDFPWFPWLSRNPDK